MARGRKKMAANTPVISRKDADEHGEDLVRKREAELPPPGYRRDEVKARQAAELARAADEANANPDVINVDPDLLVREIEKLREDRRRPRHLSHQRPDRVYVWVPETINGRPETTFIEHVKSNGYVFVEKEDPEAPEFRDSDGRRRLNGEVLMWCSRLRYEAIVADTRLKSLARRRSDMRQENEATGLILTQITPEKLEALRSEASDRRLMRTLNSRIREGGDSR